MKTTKICPGCQKPLESGAPDGLCPACLMKAGLGTGTDIGPASRAESGRTGFVAPSLEEVARMFPQLEILECLGCGGMGAVYKARQPRLDRLVALKILTRKYEDGTHDARFAERFEREARALAKLSHPNIIAMFEFGQAEALPYFIMEHVEGLNLRQLERAGKLSPHEALEIIPQICEALQFAHDEGIVHRDIKPENILLDKKGRVKIADFGIAKIVGKEADRANLTAEQQVIGTPHYMAPEQVEHPQRVDHRADIYSLGVVFYEMLTGELPLGKFAPPSKKVSVDVRLDEVVLHTLEKEPERRYQHASEVRTDVETIASGAAPVRSSAGDRRLRIPGTNLALVESRNGQRLVNWTNASLAWVLLMLAGAVCLGPVAVAAHLSGFRIGPDTFQTAGVVMAAVAAFALTVVVRQALQLPAATPASTSSASVPRPGVTWAIVAGVAAAVMVLLVFLLAIVVPRLQRAPSAASAFGPELEVSLSSLGSQAGDGFLDLDRGRIVRPPGPYSVWSRERKHEWLRENGVDLMLMGSAFQSWSLLTPLDNETKLTKVPAHAWQQGLDPEDGGRPPESAEAIQFVSQGVELLQVRLDGRPTHPDHTFAFQTANGARGVVKVSGLSLGAGEEIVGLKLRFKKFQPAAESTRNALPPAVTSRPEAVVFGPVTEVTLNDLDDLRGGEALDFDSGRLLDLPQDIKKRPESEQFQWVKEHSADVLLDHVNGRWGLLTSTDNALRLAPLPNEKWELATELDLSRALAAEPSGLEIKQHGTWTIYILSTNPQPPLTFAFQTASGASGLLQIARFGEEPNFARLRYKPTQRPPHEAAQSAELILETYANEVWTQLLPPLESVEINDAEPKATEMASDIAWRLVLPHRDAIRSHLLGQLPRGGPLLRSQWTALSDTTQFKSAPGFESFWNPITLAHTFQWLIVRERWGQEMLGKWQMLTDWAPLPDVLINSDPDRPVIVTPLGNTLMVFRLERNSEGLYRLVRGEWLSRKPEASGGGQSYWIAPADASPAPRVVQEFSKTLWDRLVPRLDAVPMSEVVQTARDIGEVIVEPKHELLREEARRILEKLPKAAAIDRAQWRSRVAQVTDADSLSAVREALNLSELELLPLRWDPLRMVNRVRHAAFLRLEHPEAMARRAIVATLAGDPLHTVANADPEHPEIITRTGNELTLVRLQRDPLGRYNLEAFEWLVAK